MTTAITGDEKVHYTYPAWSIATEKNTTKNLKYSYIESNDWFIEQSDLLSQKYFPSVQCTHNEIAFCKRQLDCILKYIFLAIWN